MKTQKIILDIDHDEEITIGLVRFAKEVPDHEIFFHLNSINPFNFTRITDFIYRGQFSDYYFPRFQAFHHSTQVCIHFISNRATQIIQKKTSSELFTEDEDSSFLLKNFQDVDYIITTSEPFDDFSVILLPENLMFQIQDFLISPEEELYQLIQYYE
ncbi:IPExxxVDY family protein [Kaistella polysaccharea]|uniref:IPExxxVDY family protein n=1 Tax=Kaistella polysaccharea TaxID=2878534 RepID=UPI001CF2F2F0|nr:IPExxxVDY family protein [Kaistella polysaccharea]